MSAYLGRFAPSPTGPLHAGSIVAALACALDAQIHEGRWLLRIEDLDPPREVPGAADQIIETLRTLGFIWHGDIMYQSQRHSAYAQAVEQLRPHWYPCICSRKDLAALHLRRTQDGEWIYPGTCALRVRPNDDPQRQHSLRLRMPARVVQFTDRMAGPQAEHLVDECGDIVIKRADGYWAYHLAVVVDDIAAGVTHVVRGADLLHSTPRQLYLYELLGARMPSYLHVPIVKNTAGEKLSKQTLAAAIDHTQPLPALLSAAQHLGFNIEARTLKQFWTLAPRYWAQYLGELN